MYNLWLIFSIATISGMGIYEGWHFAKAIASGLSILIDLLAIKLETFAKRYDCALEDASDVRSNMGENAMAKGLAAGMSEEECNTVIEAGECEQLNICNPWR